MEKVINNLSKQDDIWYYKRKEEKHLSKKKMDSILIKKDLDKKDIKELKYLGAKICFTSAVLKVENKETPFILNEDKQEWKGYGFRLRHLGSSNKKSKSKNKPRNSKALRKHKNELVLMSLERIDKAKRMIDSLSKNPISKRNRYTIKTTDGLLRVIDRLRTQVRKLQDLPVLKLPKNLNK